jgi:Beta-lactamase associated winged helix domain
MIGHRRQRERQILTLLEKGESDISEMVAAMYKGLDPRLHGAAARSVLAHLLDLERQGKASSSGECWSVAV